LLLKSDNNVFDNVSRSAAAAVSAEDAAVLM